MHFLINELSFIGQASNNYEADELMKHILEILEEISVLQNGDPIQTHSSFASQKISSELTVNQWIFIHLKSKKTTQQKITTLLLQFLSKSPHIDQKDIIDNCQCYYQKRNISSSSLTGAAKLQGILISLQNNPDFIQENIEVEFQEDTSSLENRSIKNLTEIKHAKKIFPRYKFHDKHHPKYPWEEATPMDLTDKEAQEIKLKILQSLKKY